MVLNCIMNAKEQYNIFLLRKVFEVDTMFKTILSFEKQMFSNHKQLFQFCKVSVL